MTTNTPKFKRAIRYSRTRANPLHRLPFYRQSRTRAGDFWHMPEATGYLLGKEIGRVCSAAFVQALAEAMQAPSSARCAHLADVVLSVVEAHGVALTEAQRGLVVGFFGADSVMAEVLRSGIRAKPTIGNRYTVQQIEDALTDLANLTPEEYGLRHVAGLDSIVPERRDRPAFALEVANAQ